MKRRLEIARGLVHSPQVLFLDEPTIGLDPQTRAAIWDYLHDLRRRTGITVFVTTHYMDEAEHCDRIAIMDHGEVVVEDTPEALKSSIGTDRIALRTDDDELAITRVRERLGLEAGMHEGQVTLAVPEGALVVPRLFTELGVHIRSVTRDAAQPRRRLPDLHRPHHPRLRGPAGPDVPVRREAMTMTTRDTAVPRRRRVRRTNCPRSAATCPTSCAPTWVVTRRELLRSQAGQGPHGHHAAAAAAVHLRDGHRARQHRRHRRRHDFQTFLFPGVLATSVLFTAAFAGISLVWDREFGFLREMMVAPISRASIIWGKCLGGAIVATGQSLVLLLARGHRRHPLRPGLLLGLVGCLFLGALLLTALGVLLLSTRIKTIQAAMPVSQLLIMPMMFLSGSLFPITGLPEWLAVLTRLNPLTYVVQPMRHLVLDQLSLTAAEQERLVPVLTWFGWEVPIGVQLGRSPSSPSGCVTLAARIFRTTE